MTDLEKAVCDDYRLREYSHKQIAAVLFAVGGMTAKEASEFLDSFSSALTNATLKRVVLDDKW